MTYLFEREYMWYRNKCLFTCCGVVHESQTIQSCHRHCIQHCSSLSVGVVARNLKQHNCPATSGIHSLILFLKNLQYAVATFLNFILLTKKMSQFLKFPEISIEQCRTKSYSGETYKNILDSTFCKIFFLILLCKIIVKKRNGKLRKAT